MSIMIHHHLQLIIHFLRQNPHWGGGIAFCIAFLESFPVLGAIVPGTVTMTMIGASMGAGILPITSTLLWTLSGAFIGDSSGYWLGRYFQDRMGEIWPLSHRPHWLASGRNFFARHGGKSIFLSFYMGPLRSMMPLIAGTLNFPALRFFAAIIPSACIWAALFTAPGFMLGRFSLTLPPKLAAQFILFALLSIALLWLLIWCANQAFSKIWAGINYIFYKSWSVLNKHRWLYAGSILLRDKQNPNDHYQLMRLFFILLLMGLFILTLFNITEKGIITNLNEPIYFLLRSLRNSVLTPVMIVITLFADKRVMWTTSGLITLWLMRKKYFRSAYYLLGLALTTSTTILFFKHHIASARPPEPNFPIATHSLPSGHTTLSIALLLFLSALISSALPADRKKIPFYCTSLIIVLIALSRLYLGAHWFSDIVASLLLAIAYALIASLLYFRESRPTIPAMKLSMIALLSLSVSWAGNSLYTYKDIAKIYSHSDFPTITIESSKWWARIQQPIPRYRNDRFGRPVQAFNVQWMESLQDIKDALTAEGWQDYSSDASFSAHIASMASKLPLRYLSLFPKLYQNRPPAALLSFGEQKPFLVLQLWQCNITLSNPKLNNNSPLWLGSLYYYPPSHKQKSTLDPTHALLPFLKNHASQSIMIPKRQHPPTLKKTNWGGQIILVRHK